MGKTGRSNEAWELEVLHPFPSRKQLFICQLWELCAHGNNFKSTIELPLHLLRPHLPNLFWRPSAANLGVVQEAYEGRRWQWSYFVITKVVLCVK